MGCLGTGRGAVVDAASHLALYSGDRLAAAKSCTGIRMEICPGPVTLEALNGNGYTLQHGARP